MPLNMKDPRVIKTRKGLQDALVRLILRRGYDHITVQDIAAEARTARITFYRHYRNKEELLVDCLDELYEDLIRTTEHVSGDGLRRGESPVRVLYLHIEAHEDLYRILFSSRGTSTVIDRLRHHMAEHAARGIRDAVKDADRMAIPVELIAVHAASAQLGLAMWWLEHDKPHPADDMAQLSVRMSLVGVLGMLGLNGAALIEAF